MLCALARTHPLDEAHEGGRLAVHEDADAEDLGGGPDEERDAEKADDDGADEFPERDGVRGLAESHHHDIGRGEGDPREEFGDPAAGVLRDGDHQHEGNHHEHGDGGRGPACRGVR